MMQFISFDIPLSVLYIDINLIYISVDTTMIMCQEIDTVRFHCYFFGHQYHQSLLCLITHMEGPLYQNIDIGTSFSIMKRRK